MDLGKRIKNKKHKLEQRLKKIERARATEPVINPNTKQLPKRSSNPIENTIKACPIGRKRERAGRWV
jgi:hypothetical protein